MGSNNPQIDIFIYSHQGEIMPGSYRVKSWKILMDCLQVAWN